ncbi:nuclear transport factor 2 family protein [Iodidimonas sp. SYSU 1G8]|uniref:nuclear transport factor 2 family protein n=1 Tax=Iodidimonas sp. SYSU 1G8 TaxID=3133967 RepID=UPI0031FE6645
MPNRPATGDPLDSVLSRQALHDLNALYCRALDRCDLDLLQRSFHPGATVSFGPMNTTAEEFCPIIIGLERSLPRTTHCLANEWFDIRGDRAAGECCLFSALSYDTEGQSMECFIGARYAADYERRAGEWRIAHMMLVMDWNMNNPSTAQWHLRFGVRGDRKPADLLYSGLFQ